LFVCNYYSVNNHLDRSFIVRFLQTHLPTRNKQKVINQQQCQVHRPHHLQMTIQKMQKMIQTQRY